MTSLAAAAAPPAGGAEVAQVVAVTLAVNLLIAGLAVFGWGHRTGRIGLLRWASNVSLRVSGLPGWAGIPAMMAVVFLLPALFGLVWDESLHIDQGRDAGPLANPSHFFLLVGLLGIFAAGWLSLVLPMPGERPGPAALRLTRDWHVPAGGVLVTAGASFALVGFPLDDVSHRLFGQDVTLWGTTHLWMMTGAVVTVIGTLVLLAEGRLATRAARAARPERPRLLVPLATHRFRLVIASGGILAAASIYQGEFDFGVPQFRLVFHPLLIAGAAALALVAARIMGGRGAALGAVAFFLAVRGAYTVLVGPVLGESVAHFPLYLAEALVVEALALVLVPRRRPYAFAVAAGVLVATVGLLAEYAWSHVWMPVQWPAHLLPEAIALSLPVAIGCGVLGAFLACAIRLDAPRVVARPAIASAALAFAVVAAVFALLVPTGGADARARITLQPAGDGLVTATVRFDPPSAARDADWLSTIAWQGGERVRIEDLREVAPDVWRSAPLPVTGSWKTAIRLHRGDVMAGIPVYAPADAAIPVPETRLPADSVQPVGEQRDFLQRERKADASEGLEVGARLFVVAGVLVLFGLAGLMLVRLARTGAAARAPVAARRATAPAREAVEA